MAGRRNNKIQCENCHKQSLMSSLNNFVDAVNVMDQKVMVPSRLRDMELAQTETSGQGIDIAEENNNMTIASFPPSRGEDMYSFYQMINAVKDELMTGNESKTVCDSEAEVEISSDDSSDDGQSEDPAKKAACAFRYHLQGLFSVLNQLTDAAKYLGETYEDQVGTSRKAQKFTF